jgi:hypothetical protein
MIESVFETARRTADWEKTEERQAYEALVGRLYREVQMLRRHQGEVAPFGDFACPVCFRTFPHSAYVHEREAELFGRLRSIDVSGHEDYYHPERVNISLGTAPPPQDRMVFPRLRVVAVARDPERESQVTFAFNGVPSDSDIRWLFKRLKEPK